MKCDDVIKYLDLKPLPYEGGMFRQTYVSNSKDSDRPTSTAIYFLLTENNFSHLHRLPTDEVYHFYLGDRVEVLELFPDGTSKKTILGSDLANGEQPQYVSRAGAWQGLKVVEGGKFALLGTTMAPGYVDTDYEHGERAELCEQYPEVKNLIIERTGEAVAK